MFYAVVAGKIWSFISSLTNKDESNVGGIVILVLLAAPLAMAVLAWGRKRQLNKKDNNAPTEVPEQIANYLAMGVLMEAFKHHEILIHSASARIIVKASRWHLSVFMARIEIDNEIAMLTCEFDMAATPLDQERIQLTTVKSLHRCTTETSEIETKIAKILGKFTVVLDYPGEKKHESEETELKRKCYVRFVSAIVLAGAASGELRLKNGGQTIVTDLSDITNTVCVFDQFQPGSVIDITRSGQTLSVPVSQTGRHELIVGQTKLIIELYRAVGDQEIDAVQAALAKAMN